ncbi:MAG: peptidylprolyl isomerase [Polyangiales bacterium]
MHLRLHFMWLWTSACLLALGAGWARGEAPADARELATWRGGRITIADLLGAAALKVPAQRARIATPEGRVAFLRELTRYDLLVAEAERRGYGSSPLAQVAARRAAIDGLIAKELAVSPQSIAESAVVERYARDAAQYRRPAMRRASHIRLATAAEAQALIREIAGSSREKFAATARDRSLDQATSRQGGELGWFTREGKNADGSAVAGLSTPLVEAAFALKGAQSITTTPVRIDGGFSVLLLTGDMKPFERPLAKVGGEIRETLAAERTKQRVDELATALMQTSHVETHPELLSAIRLDTQTPADIPQGFPASPEDPRARPKVIVPDGY